MFFLYLSVKHELFLTKNTFTFFKTSSNLVVIFSLLYSGGTDPQRPLHLHYLAHVLF